MNKARQRGVTLIEVLIVVAIMALISGGIGMMVLKKWRFAQIETTKTRAQALRGAVAGYEVLGLGHCPSAAELVDAEELEPDNRVDAWGRELDVTCEGARVTIRSSGPDRELYTTDDIVVPVSAMASQ